MDLSSREEKFSTVYGEFRQKIYRICYGFINEKQDVEDLFQEIMINIWNNLDKFRGESQLGTWIYRIAVNTALFYNRKSRNYSKLKDNVKSYEPDINNSEQEEYDMNDARLKKLAFAISKLEKNDRLIISLLLEGLSYETISEVVGISANYVGVKVNRIKKQLKKHMQNEQ